MLKDIIIALIIMLLVLYVMNLVVPFHLNNKFVSILDICLYALVGGAIYIVITYRMGIINKLFGKKMVGKVLKVITFGKVKIKGENDDSEEN